VRSNHSASRVVWTLTLCTSLALLGDSTLYAVLPSYHPAVGIGVVQVGWLLSMNRLVRPPLNMLSGWLSQRLGPRTPYIVGLSIGALSTIGYSLCRGFWPLLAMRALWGVAWALLAVSAYGLMLDVTVESTRGRLAGIYTSISYFGGALGAMGGGFLVDALGFSPAMFILGALSIGASLLALTLPRTQHLPARHVAPGVSLAWRPRLQAGAHALRRLDARLWLVLALSFAHRFLFAGVFYSTFGLYLQQTLGESLHVGAAVIGVASFTGTVLFLRNVVSVLVGPGLGYLSDVLGERSRVLLLGEVLGVAALACLALADSLWISAAGVLLAAMAYGIVPPMLVSWMGDLTRTGARGTIVGGYQTMGDLGSGVGPLVAYALAAAWGLPAVYGLGAALCALTVPLILLVRSRAAGRAPLAVADHGAHGA
jgi:MFS family permease